MGGGQHRREANKQTNKQKKNIAWLMDRQSVKILRPSPFLLLQVYRVAMSRGFSFVMLLIWYHFTVVMGV